MVAGPISLKSSRDPYNIYGLAYSPSCLRTLHYCLLYSRMPRNHSGVLHLWQRCHPCAPPSSPSHLAQDQYYFPFQIRVFVSCRQRQTQARLDYYVKAAERLESNSCFARRFTDAGATTLLPPLPCKFRGPWRCLQSRAELFNCRHVSIAEMYVY